MLASASAARRSLLKAAGLRFEAVATDLDEATVKRAAQARAAPPAEAALTLAGLKARALDRPDAMVIGCDQILVCGDTWFDKPQTLAAAADQLRALRGRTHRLETATVVLCNGAEIWRHLASPCLRMRRFTEDFLSGYLEQEGARVLSCVGAYRLEGPGVQLFDAIEGEHSAVLGLPMLPLLRFLRESGMICV